MHRHVRRAVEFLAARVERRPLQCAAVLPAPLMRAERPHALAVEPRAKAEAAAGRAIAFGAMLMPPPTSVSAGRLLVDIDLETRPGAAPPRR